MEMYNVDFKVTDELNQIKERTRIPFGPSQKDWRNPLLLKYFSRFMIRLEDTKRCIYAIPVEARKD
jgi:hypothetical protein